MKFKLGKLIEKFKAKNGKEVVIRIFKYGDLKQLLNHYNELMREDTFLIANRKKTLKEEKRWLKSKLEEMKRGERINIVAEVDKKIVGCASLRKGVGNRSPHLREIGIAVLKKYRGLGIGNEMTSQLIRIAKRAKCKILLLGVFANNKVAIRMYKKLGFKQVARLPKIFLYKGRYVDDIWMIKKL